MELREQIVADIIAKASSIFGRDDITEETRFIDDLKAKSMHLVQIVTMLEDTYDVEVQYMKFRRYPTVGEAADFVLSLCEE